MKLNYEIEMPDGNVKSIEFKGEPRWENDGIGPYEFGSEKCQDQGTDYVSMEHNGSPKWGKKLYSDEENKVIESRLQEVEDDFCNQFKKEYEENERLNFNY